MTIHLQEISLPQPAAVSSPSTATGTSSSNPYQQPKPPYTDSVPNTMSHPGSLPGSDVLTSTYLWLNWLTLNPENTNGPQVFLLYLSNYCAQGAAGMYDMQEFDDLANTIASIQNKDGKSLVAECVDITMEMTYLTNGGNAQAAHDEIYTLFPPSQTDPISTKARAEADKELTVMQSYSSASGSTNPPPTQASIQKEWYDYISDPSTVSSIKHAQSTIMGSSIDACNGNIYLALITLLLLLEGAGIGAMNSYGSLSDQLADESAKLNSLITRWNAGFETADDAEAWMNDLQSLQDEMDATPFDDATHILIDEQFNDIKTQPALTPTYSGYHDNEGNAVTSKGQAVDANGYPLYEVENSNNDNGKTAYKKGDTYYIEGTNTPVDSDKHTTYQPLYWTDDPSAKGGLTDNSGTTVNGRSNPKSTVPGITPTEYDNYLYIDPNNHYLYTVSATGTAPPGATVYTANTNDQFQGMQYYVANHGTAVFLQPPPSTQRLTLGDQAYNGNSYTYISLTFNATGTSRSYKNNGKGTNANLYTTMQIYQRTAINPNNPSIGGFPSEDQQTINSLNALVAPLSQQTAAVGTEMQQTSSNIELYDNTFSSILIKGLNQTMSTLMDNMKV